MWWDPIKLFGDMFKCGRVALKANAWSFNFEFFSSTESLDWETLLMWGATKAGHLIYRSGWDGRVGGRKWDHAELSKLALGFWRAWSLMMAWKIQSLEPLSSMRSNQTDDHLIQANPFSSFQFFRAERFLFSSVGLADYLEDIDDDMCCRICKCKVQRCQTRG